MVITANELLGLIEGVAVKDNPIWVLPQGSNFQVQVAMNNNVYTLAITRSEKAAVELAKEYKSGKQKLTTDWKGDAVGTATGDSKWRGFPKKAIKV